MFDMWSGVLVETKKVIDNQLIKFYLYYPYLQITICLIGLNNTWCVSNAFWWRVRFMDSVLRHFHGTGFNFCYTISVCLYICILSTCEHKHTNMYIHQVFVSPCMFSLMTRLWSGAQRPTVAQPSTGLPHSTFPNTFPRPPTTASAPRWTAHLHKGASTLRLWSSTLFIIWSAMIDALLIQI